MVDIDDNNVKAEQCPIIEIAKQVQIKDKNVYRVSWNVGESRKERFFKTKDLAESFIIKLEAGADIVGTVVKPLIGVIEVADE